MDYLTYTEKLNYLLELVKNEQVFSIKQISKKYNCSESTVKRMLRTLRIQGHQIKYCKKVKRYFIEI